MYLVGRDERVGRVEGQEQTQGGAEGGSIRKIGPDSVMGSLVTGLGGCSEDGIEELHQGRT